MRPPRPFCAGERSPNSLEHGAIAHGAIMRLLGFPADSPCRASFGWAATALGFASSRSADVHPGAPRHALGCGPRAAARRLGHNSKPPAPSAAGPRSPLPARIRSWAWRLHAPRPAGCPRATFDARRLPFSVLKRPAPGGSVVGSEPIRTRSLPEVHHLLRGPVDTTIDHRLTCFSSQSSQRGARPT